MVLQEADVLLLPMNFTLAQRSAAQGLHLGLSEP